MGNQFARLLPTTLTGRALWALAVIMTLVILAGGTVLATSLQVTNSTSGGADISQIQFTTETCVKAIDDYKFTKSTKSTVDIVTVDTKQKNTCSGARMKVVVVDKNGEQATGAEVIPTGQDQFDIDLVGDARKNQDPKAYIVIY